MNFGILLYNIQFITTYDLWEPIVVCCNEHNRATFYENSRFFIYVSKDEQLMCTERNECISEITAASCDWLGVCLFDWVRHDENFRSDANDKSTLFISAFFASSSQKKFLRLFRMFVSPNRKTLFKDKEAIITRKQIIHKIPVCLKSSKITISFSSRFYINR
jgi:hypothetical protein